MARLQCGATVEDSVTSAITPGPPTRDCLQDPIRNLLTSNTCPVESEMSFVARKLTETENLVDALGARIDTLRVEMAKLSEERDYLVSRVHQYKTVLSPVRRVPPEVLCEIFAWRLPRSTRTIGPDTRVDQPPWTLAHVCRSWREIALGYTPLWRSFTIIHGVDFDPYFPQAMVETQLCRTAGAPFCIDFDWRDGDTLGDSSVWDLLLPHSRRWESLRIQCTNPATAKILLDLLHATKGHLPQLAKIEFLIDSDEPWELKWDLFSTAPRLHEVLITNALFERYSPQFLIPWARITRYRGVFPAAQQLDILRSSHNLVECSIGVDNIMDSARGVMAVRLPLLRRLRVEGSAILTYITAPALEDLWVECATTEVNPTSSVIESFLHRSSCRLSILVLSRYPFPEGLVPLLTVCPSLTQFILDGIWSCDFSGMSSLLTAMEGSSSNTIICPNLTSLVISWFKIPDFTWAESFFRVIQSRIINSSDRPRLQSLRHVRLFHTDEGEEKNVPSAFQDGIQRLENEGFDIKYLSPEEGELFMDQLRP